MIKFFRASFLSLQLYFAVGLMISCNSGQKEPPIVDARAILQIDQDSLILQPNKGLYFHNGEPFSGKAISTYADQTQSTSIEYKSGKKHGRYVRWFQNGIKSFESNYVDGKQEGKTFSWWQNGNKRSDSNYKAGVPDGEQREWYKSGAKFKKIILVNGQEEGLQQSWRENGKLYNNYEAKNGRIFGLKRAALCFQLEDEEVQYKVD